MCHTFAQACGHFTIQIIFFVLQGRGPKFRKEFSNITEIRSLTPKGTNILALTATAN